MPRHCSAGGCKSRDTRDSRKAGITFHRLPKRENPRRGLWIINSRRTDPQGQGLWDPQSDFIYFCSKHFTPGSFELSGVSGYRRLKDDALPTVFESFTGQKGRAAKKTTRGKGKQADTGKPARTKASTLKEASDRHDVQQTATDTENVTGGETSHTSEAANGEANNQQGVGSGSTPQASSETPVTPLQTHQSACDTASDQPSSPRPTSPSRYMRRLPPPPGFYLPREHSYAQLCPLVWRKRYDRAIDNLEKALRLLSAARRRESRLRHAVVRLRESRLRSKLFRLREGGGRGKEGRGGRGRSLSWSAQRGIGGGGGGGGEPVKPGGGACFGSMDDSELEGAVEDLDVLGEEAGGWRGQGRMRGAGEEEDGCCFYCGRGRDSEGPREGAQRTVEGDVGGDEREGEGRRGRRGAKQGRARKPGETRGDVRDASKECYFYYYQTSETEEDMAEARVDIHGNLLRPLPVAHQQAESCVQVQPLAGAPFPTVTLQDSTSTPFQLIQSSSSVPQRLLLTDLVSSEGTLVEGQQESDQQQYWVQETTEGSVLLIPVPSAEGKGTVTVRGVSEDMDTQTIFVSDVGFHSNPTEDREGLRAEGDTIVLRCSGPSDRQGSLQSNVKGAVLSGDVKEKLKEHLEGFQLQLSDELMD